MPHWRVVKTKSDIYLHFQLCSSNNYVSKTVSGQYVPEPFRAKLGRNQSYVILPTGVVYRYYLYNKMLLINWQHTHTHIHEHTCILNVQLNNNKISNV